MITIYTEEADQISGLKVTVNDMLYYQIRYLDSDSYAMLQGDWAYDYGYFVSGDEDAFYTEAEKEKQKRLQEEARGYSTLYSFLFNEDKTEFTCSCAEGNFCKVSSEEAE